MVTCWLQHNYDTSCHGLPTWEKLVQVIGSPAGGNNTALTLTIAQQHNVSIQQPTQAHMAQGGYISQQSISFDTSPGHGTISLEHQNVSHASVSSDTSTIITDDPLSPTLQTYSSPHPHDDTKLQTDLPPHYIKKPLLSAMTSEMLNLQELVSELNQEFITNSFKTKKYLKKHANFLDVREYIITHVISLTKLSDNKNEELLRQTFLEATTFEQLFEVLTKYTSWYNYDLIVKLSRLFLRHDHKVRKEMEENMKKYLTLGVGVKEYHGPMEFGENSNGDRKVFAVKVPSEKLVYSDLFTFHKALAKSLKQTKFLLYFWSIQRGCLELKYLVPNFLSTDISNALPQAMTEYLPQLGISEVHWNGSRYVLDKVSYIILMQWAYNNLYYIRYQIPCYCLQISCNN